MNLFVFDETLAALYLDDTFGAGAGAAMRQQIEAPVDTLSMVTSRALATEAFSPHQLWFRTANIKSFRDVGTLIVLIEKAHASRRDEPTEGRVLLEGVISALQTLKDWPTRERSFLLVRAWTYLGNIHRILNDFPQARNILAQAKKLSNEAANAPHPLIWGELLWLRGALHRDERQYADAVAALKEADKYLLEAGSSTTRIEAQITLANTYREMGELQHSIAILEGLLEAYPATGFPPGTCLAELQLLALSYAQVGQAEEAKALLPRVRRLAEEEGNLLDLVRVDWTEAEVHKAAGHRTLAAAGFRDVAAKFMAAQLPVDAALATLSQAEMYLELGDTKAAAGLAEALVPIFQSKGIHREATVAGLMVVEDLRREAATLVQVQGLVERLQGRATQSS